MATGYSISIGYLSNGEDAEAWQALLDITEALSQDTDKLLADARRLHAPEEPDGEPLSAFAAIYQLNQPGCPIVISSDRQSVDILASGDGQSRLAKEHMARAFCRLVMEAMHQRGYEISIVVV